MGDVLQDPPACGRTCGDELLGPGDPVEIARHGAEAVVRRDRAVGEADRLDLVVGGQVFVAAELVVEDAVERDEVPAHAQLRGAHASA